MSLHSAAPPNRWLYAAIGALLALSLLLQVVRDRGWAPYQPPGGVMWIRSGPLAQRLALGFDNFVADVYWMRAVIYYGSQRREDRVANFDQLYPLLDLVTSLDPYFRVAYRFGSIFLAEPFPGGAGRPDQAVQLLQKGLEVTSDRWEYALDIGFVYYWWARDYARAAEWFKKAADIPGAAHWLAPMAATTLAEGGNRQSSRELWTRLRDETEAEWIRTAASHRLQQLDALDAIDELNRASEAFIKKRGRPAADWRELAIDQRWPSIPVDPSGAQYRLDGETGRVTLGNASRLHPLPEGAMSIDRVPKL
jgi:tetratricopeptide (TPR) repeat protein